jgi:BASS family bile acid:Na+ symporter
MEPTILTTIVLPVALFVIMLGMGLSLVIDDFRRIVTYPKAMCIGIGCQLLLLPVVGLCILSMFRLESPELAVGLMLLTFCPGGAMSNLMTYLAKGDIALSISLTAVVSMVTPFTIPIMTGLSMDAFMSDDATIQFPIAKTILSLMGVVILPAVIGMAIRHKWVALAKRAEAPVKVLSVIFLFGIIAALVIKNRAQLPYYLSEVGPPALVLNVTTMLLGYLVARATRLNRAQQATIGIEVGIQNGAMAIMVAGTLLENAAMTIPAAVYSLIMFVTGGIFGWLINLNRPAARPAGHQETGSDPSSN